MKVFLTIIQMFGQNLARQREKISSCIEDLAALQTEVYKNSMFHFLQIDILCVFYFFFFAAFLGCLCLCLILQVERVETDFDLLLGGQLTASGRSITAFVIYHVLRLIEYHFYLSFHLELFVPYEYPFVYWWVSHYITTEC